MIILEELAGFTSGLYRARHGMGMAGRVSMKKFKDNSKISGFSFRDGKEIYTFCTPEFMVRDLYWTPLWHTKELKDSKQH